MAKKTGFTLIEILMVLAIMTILIAIGGYQINLNKRRALFMEYKNATERVANVFNDLYQTGNFGTGYTWARKGSYPSEEEMNEWSSSKTLPEKIAISAQTIEADKEISHQIWSENSEPSEGLHSCSDLVEYDIKNLPIIYYPITGDGKYCEDKTMECRRVKLFYRVLYNNEKCATKSIELGSGMVVKNE